MCDYINRRGSKRFLSTYCHISVIFMEASIFPRLSQKPQKPTKPYTPSILTQIPHKATATKLVTARLLRDSLTDTSSNPTNPSNIRLYSTEEQTKICSSFYTLLSLELAFLWNFCGTFHAMN